MAEEPLQDVRYRANPGFISREIMGEYILVPTGAQTERLNGFITLTESGAYLWQQLQEPKSAGELAAALAAEYGLAVQDVMQDAEAFLQKAVAQDLVHPV